MSIIMCARRLNLMRSNFSLELLYGFVTKISLRNFRGISRCPKTIKKLPTALIGIENKLPFLRILRCRGHRSSIAAIGR